jgi:hypothetical protein
MYRLKSYKQNNNQNLVCMKESGKNRMYMLHKAYIA